MEKIRVVYSLLTLEEIEEAWGSLDYYESLLRERGIRLNFREVQDGEPPSEEVVTEIYESTERARTLVHCVGGIGRTGTALTAYLILKRGYDPTTAISYVRKVRPGAVQTFKQEMFLWDIWERRVKGKDQIR